MKFTVFSASLFFLGWMSVVTGIDVPVTCCLEMKNTKVQAEYIVKYDIQEAVKCPVRAVRFYTLKNKVLCSDPENIYTKILMKKVDERMKTTPPSKEPIKCYKSTTNMIPVVTIKNKTPGTQTEARTSTTAPTIVTTVETTRTETEITKTTNQPTSVPKENPESSFSTASTCGTTHDTPGIDTSTHLATFTTKDKTVPTSRVINTGSTVRTKPSKLKIKRDKKSKKNLRKYQMRKPQG